MVSVNLNSSGAQRTYLVTVKSQGTQLPNYSASVRTQHSGRAETAMNTLVKLSSTMESGAGAVNSTAFIPPTDFLDMKHGVIKVVWLNVKIKVIRYLKDTHSAT